VQNSILHLKAFRSCVHITNHDADLPFVSRTSDGQTPEPLTAMWCGLCVVLTLHLPEQCKGEHNGSLCCCANTRICLACVPMTVLDGGCLYRRAPLTHVKVGKLAIVLASAHKAGVLQVEIDRGQLALGRQLKVWRVGVADIPDITAHGAVVWLLLELQDGVCNSNLQQ